MLKISVIINLLKGLCGQENYASVLAFYFISFARWRHAHSLDRRLNIVSRHLWISAVCKMRCAAQFGNSVHAL